MTDAWGIEKETNRRGEENRLEGEAVARNKDY